MNEINNSIETINNKSKTTVHVGLDLSLKGTGLTFYIENEMENIKKFKFYILLYEKSSTIAYMNVNQIILEKIS